MERDKENMIAEEKTEVVDAAAEKAEVLRGKVEDYRIIKLKNPIKFEEKNYTQIDLRNLDDITAADMVAINRRMTRNGNVDVSPELTLEYALNMANLVTGLPLEFSISCRPMRPWRLKDA